tara:strand:+ start:1338 stop:1781 length:444 start_codon:yes stop_codon:yes gene_type:complete
MTTKLEKHNKYFVISSEKSYGLLFKFLRKLYTEKLIVFLSGDIGVGKTTFVKYYIKSLNSNKNAYSPTFSLINEYAVSNLKIYHYDLYRLNNYRELQEIGVDYSLNLNGIHFVEWPNNFIKELPSPNIHINFQALEYGTFLSIYNEL